jgi:hypothetical protein
VVEHLSGMCEFLNLICSTKKRREGKMEVGKQEKKQI